MASFRKILPLLLCITVALSASALAQVSGSETFTDSVIFKKKIGYIGQYDFTGDGKYVYGVTDNDSLLIFWNAKTGDTANKKTLSLQGVGGFGVFITQVNLSSVNKLFVVKHAWNPSATILIYKLDLTFTPHFFQKMTGMNAIALHPGTGDLLALPSKDSVVRIYRYQGSPDTMLLWKTLKVPNRRLFYLSFTPDSSKLIALCKDDPDTTTRIGRIYDAATYNEISTFVLPGDGFSVQYDPRDGTVYTERHSLRDSILYILNPSTWQIQDSMKFVIYPQLVHINWAFRCDGKRMAFTPYRSYDTVHVWDTDKRQLLYKIGGFGQDFRTSASEAIFSPVGNRLLVGGLASNSRSWYLIGYADSSGRVGVEQQQKADRAGRLQISASVSPQPAATMLRVEYRLVSGGPVYITLADNLGKRVGRYSLGWQESGGHQLMIDCSRYGSGGYLCVIDCGQYQTVQPLTVAR